VKDGSRVLVIDPGSTSTKVGVLVQEVPTGMDQLSPVACEWTCNLVHPIGSWRGFAACRRFAQSEFRAAAIKEALAAGRYSGVAFAAVAGRGGLLPPMECGTWVDERADD
jgi:butyrate kinase